MPLRDDIQSHRVPFVNYGLMALCTLAFWLEFNPNIEIDSLFQQFGLVPQRATRLAAAGNYWHPGFWLPFVTSMFLHGGFAHFLGNMLFLWIFGDNVEDRFGHLGYIGFYLLGGMVAGFAHLLSNPDSTIPTIGASGAIAAVMGAYFVLYPRARVLTLLIFIIIPRTFSVPAYVYLAMWFGWQVLFGTATLSASGAETGGVAWWAHAGGFAFGVLAILVVGRGSLAKL